MRGFLPYQQSKMLWRLQPCKIVTEKSLMCLNFHLSVAFLQMAQSLKYKGRQW